jgi:ATP-binding cassette, subfamily B (MDR/TAP), member 1
LGTSQPLGFCIENVVQAISSLGVCFYYSWKVTLVTLAGIPPSVIGLSILASKMQSSIIRQELEMAKASNLACNALSSIDTVKCFNGQDSEVRQYGLAVQKAAKFYLKQALNNGLQIGFVKFILTSMFVQGFWYGSYLVRKGDTLTGTVITTFWSALMATRAWEDTLPHLNVLGKGRAAAIALKAILDKVENGRKITKLTTGITPKFCEGDIEVRSASSTHAYQAVSFC